MKKNFTLFISIALLCNANAQTVNWVQYGGGTGYDVISEMVKDADNNFYATGQIENNATFGATAIAGGVFVAKYDSNGVQKMAVAHGDVHAAGKSICLDHSGNIYVLGWMDSTVMLGNTILNHIGGFDIFLTKYDTIGNLIWVKQFGGSKGDKGIEIICDKNNQLFFAGYFSDTAQFGNNTVIATSDSSEIFIN